MLVEKMIKDIIKSKNMIEQTIKSENVCQEKRLHFINFLVFTEINLYLLVIESIFDPKLTCYVGTP